MQHNSTDQLNIVVAHLNATPASFACNGERFRQQVVQCLACAIALYHVGKQLIHSFGLDGHDFWLQLLENVSKQLLQALIGFIV